MAGRFGSGSWFTRANTPLFQPATDALFAWRHGNGLARRTTHDANGRITAIASGTSQASVQSLGFGHTRGQHTISSLDNAVAPATSASLSYDLNNRLDEVVRSADGQDFAWDTVGKHTATVRNGQTFQHQSFSDSNRLWKITRAATRTMADRRVE